MGALTNQAHVQVYADGSRSKEGVAAGAALYVNGQLTKTSGFRLGDQENHSALDAEMAAIILAAHLICGIATVDDVTIFSDSQLAIKGLRGQHAGISQSLLRTAERAVNRAKKRSGDNNLEVLWCPGHAGIAGSDRADAEAKLAASGKSYPRDCIPEALVKHRPLINATVLKQAVKAQNQNIAITFWRNTPAGSKHHTRYPLAIPADFLKLAQHLSRPKATLLFRLLSGHVQLRQHLHRLQAVNSPMCEHCENALETVAHFIRHCPHFSSERYIYLESNGPHYTRPDYLFSNEEALRPLFEFLKATGRFASLLL